MGALEAIPRLGPRIPDEIALAGFDAFERGDLVSPQIMGGAQATYELGRTAAQLLVARIQNPAAPSSGRHSRLTPPVR